MDKLQTTFLNVDFPNPLITPSGIIQEIKDHIRAEKAGAGGVVTKSLTVEPREGNPMPRVIRYDHGFLNSVGLKGPGMEEGMKQVAQFIKASNIPVIISIFAVKIGDFKKLAKTVATLDTTLIELNLSCPNTVDEIGEPLGKGVESTEAAVSEVRKIVGSKKKLIAKLSPNVQNIKDIAKAAQSAGADAISAINTVGPGMVIDIEKKKPLLGNKEGGISGPGIKPIAIRNIYDIYEAVDIPIIGMGGVSDWKDAVEMMMAGASLVGVGSATYIKGYKVYEEIKTDLLKYMKEKRLDSLNSLVGAAH